MPLRLKDNQSQQDRIRSFLELPPGIYVPNAKSLINPASIGAVEMEWGAVTGPNARYPGLGTESIATCMGFAVHNPITKATGLAHLAQDGASTDLSPESYKSLIAMLNQLGGKHNPLEVRIIGPNVGGSYAGEYVYNVTENVKADYDLTVLSADFGPKAGMMSVGVHAAYWDSGLIRGKLPMREILNAQTQGGQEEVSRLSAQLVNLEQMSFLPGGVTPDGLRYNGLTETTGPEHNHGMD